MCSASPPRTPDVVERNPIGEAQQAADQGQWRANQAIAARKKRRRGQSLLTMGAEGYTGAPAASLLASARPADT